MDEKKNLLDPFVMQNIAKIESKAGEKTQSKVSKMVMQAIKGKKRNNIEWFCYFSLYFDEKEEVTKQAMEIARGPILTSTVPLIKRKIEERCGAEIQNRNFGNGNQLFFVRRIESSTDIFSVDSAIRRKLNEPDGDEAMKKEIERTVGKLEIAFNRFDNILNRMILV